MLDGAAPSLHRLAELVRVGDLTSSPLSLLCHSPSSSYGSLTISPSSPHPCASSRLLLKLRSSPRCPPSSPPHYPHPSHLSSIQSILAPLRSRPHRRCRGLAEIYATLRVGTRDKTLAVIVGRAVNESHSNLRPITPPPHSVSQELYLHTRRCSLDHLAEASQRDGGDRTLANSEITNTQVRNASASSSSIPLGH